MKLGKAVLGKTLFAYIMKQTFYGQFVAGEDRQSIKPAIHRMHSFGVKSILDYSVEEDVSTEKAEQLEMDACVADEEKDNYNPDIVPHKGTHMGEWSGIWHFLYFFLIFQLQMGSSVTRHTRVLRIVVSEIPAREPIFTRTKPSARKIWRLFLDASRL